MNPVVKLVESFIKQFDELEELSKKINKERSDIDKALSKWYHTVEGTEIKHVSESHSFMKEVKVILARRRDLKIEDLIVRSTCDILRAKINELKKHHTVLFAKNDKVKEEILNGGK